MPAFLTVRLSATVLLITALAAPSLAWGSSSSESSFVSMTGSARSGHGLRAYAVSSDLTAVARRWAARMAAHRTLAHNPSYTRQACCWTKLGENVGVGSSAGQIERAFMASAPHRANILSSSFTQVGIGTARSSDGRLWVDEVFRRPTSSAPRAARASTARTATRSAAPTVHPAARTPRLVAARAVSGRAARSAFRHPRAPVARAAVMSWAQRVAWAQGAAGPGAADPVAGALTFLRVMQRLDGSAAG